jgi:hypothetical protein
LESGGFLPALASINQIYIQYGLAICKNKINYLMISMRSP